MKHLPTIHDIEENNLTDAIKHIKPRVAARAVVLDGKAVALLHVTRDGYHKLPGGGLEGSESILDALHRELLEEIGCQVQDIQLIAQVNDYRREWDFYQESFCYLAQVKTKDLPINMTKKELAAGFKVQWVPSIQEAISIIEQDKPTTYEGGFIQKRDLLVLKEAKKLLHG